MAALAKRLASPPTTPKGGPGRGAGLRPPNLGWMSGVPGFLCMLQVELHFPDNASLKGKRKELQSLKAVLHRRFGATVAETGHHELWQRATLSAAVVGREAGEVSEAGAAIERFVHDHFPQGAVVERRILSAEEIL